MNNSQDRTPQFYDVRAGRGSPLHHVVASASRAQESSIRPSRATKVKLPRKGGKFSTILIVAAIAYGFISSYLKQHDTPTTPPVATQQTIPEDVPVSGSLEQRANQHFHQGNYHVAGQLYRACGYQGNAECQRSLAYLYSNGMGVTRDDEQAFEWLQKAAIQGNATAQDDLGVMYGDGRGVKQDWVQSFLWISRSAAQGSTQAREDMKYVISHMTPAQRNEALARWNEEIKVR